MSTITMEVPNGTESKYKVFFETLTKNYSIDDLEDTLLGLHIEKNRNFDDFVSEEEVFSVLKS